MTPKIHDQDPHRFRVKVLFGLFEADATGAVAIGAVIAMFFLFGAGRFMGLF